MPEAAHERSYDSTRRNDSATVTKTSEQSEATG